MKKEKHQHRWSVRVWADRGERREAWPGAVSVSKSSTLTKCPRALPGSGAGKCMTSRSGRASREAARGRWRGAQQKGASMRPGREAWVADPCPSLDRIKREKGVWWMPWQQEAMKDVIPCDKQRGAGNGL